MKTAAHARTDEDFCALPSEESLIHPAMSPLMGGTLVRACEKLQVSLWDREKLYQAIISFPGPEV